MRRSNEASSGPRPKPPTQPPSVPEGPLRIQTFAELTGVPEPTLRAWERRYGVPSPVRTASGYRLYGPADVRQVREMRRLCVAGMAVAADWANPAIDQDDAFQAAASGIVDAIALLDDARFDEQLRRAMLLGPSTAVFERVLAPALARVGELWHEGAMSIAEEHFASQRIGQVVRELTRLLVRDDADGTAIVACAADEEHEIGALGVAMRLATWGLRPVFLGARTPPAAVRAAVETVKPRLVALSFTLLPARDRAEELVSDYARACRQTPWIVGGATALGMADIVEKAGGRVTHDVPSLRAAVRIVSEGHGPKPSRKSRRPGRR